MSPADSWIVVAYLLVVLQPIRTGSLHFTAYGFHISHVLVHISQNCDSRGTPTRTPAPLDHGVVHNMGIVPARSASAPYPSHGSAPQSHGPHVSQSIAHKGNHDVQCASGTNFSGRDLRIHLRAGAGSVGFLIPNPRRHAEAWESLTPTPQAVPKYGSPSQNLKGQQRSVGALNPNSRGHMPKSMQPHPLVWVGGSVNGRIARGPNIQVFGGARPPPRHSLLVKA